MAHLSERHEVAKRRRDELLRERSLSLALRTGYPETFHERRQVTPREKTVEGIPSPGAELERKKYTTEELDAARLRCEDRVKTAKEKQARERRLEMQSQASCNDQPSSTEAAAMAVQRLRERKEKERRLEEQEVEILISQQTSSIKAMNIARMLSPRFQERVVFTPSITKHSTEDGRVTQLLTNTHVGTFYQ